MAKRQQKAPAGLSRRQASRAQRESRLQRGILIGTAVVGVIIVGLIGYAAITEEVIAPNRPLVTVGDETITEGQFSDRLWIEFLLHSSNQFTFAPFNPEDVLNEMIDELVLANQADEMGIEISEAELREELQLQFGYDAGDPEPTFTPFPTQPVSDETATPTATFVYTLTPSPTPTIDPSVTPTATATATATPDPDAEPTATPTETPTTEPVPTEEVTEDDFTLRYEEFVSGVALSADVSESTVRDYLDNTVRMGLLRERVREELDLEFDETKILVHAAHILVETEEEADAVIERLDAGEVFEELAAELSSDSSAHRGGDLGWFGTGAMVPAFEEAAFALDVGEISDRVQSDFGWHIIKVYDRAIEDTTVFERENQQSQGFIELLDQWREDIGVDIDPQWIALIPEEILAAIQLEQQQQPGFPGLVP